MARRRLLRKVGDVYDGDVHVDRDMLKVRAIEVQFVTVRGLRERLAERLGYAEAERHDQSTIWGESATQRHLLLADRDEANRVSARPIRQPTLPVHVDNMVDVADDIELVIRVAPLPGGLEVLVEVRETAHAAFRTAPSGRDGEQDAKIRTRTDMSLGRRDRLRHRLSRS